MLRLLLPLLGALLLAACPDEPSEPVDDDDVTESDDDDTTGSIEVPEDWEPAADDSGLKEPHIAPLSPVTVIPERPFSGHPVRVDVALGEAATAELALEGPGCGTLDAGSLETPGSMEGFAASQGWCRVEVTATLGDGAEVSHSARFLVAALDPVLPPLELEGGLFRDSELPPESGGPTAAVVNAETSLLPASAGSVELEWAGALPVAAVAMWVEGHEGWWLLPVDGETWDGTLQLFAPADVFERLEESRDVQVNVQLALIDVAGNRGPGEPLAPRIVPAGTGDVQIALFF